jgi:hypothetical protein
MGDVDGSLDQGAVAAVGAAALTVSQLRALVETVAHKRIIMSTLNNADHKAGDPFKIVDAHDARISYTITPDEYDKRLVQAVAIMLAESGGWPLAECRDSLPNWAPPGVKPRTDAPCNKPGRGVDRGLWQFNSKAFPQISDLAAFDPAQACEAAYIVSNGYKDWGPWHGSKGLDPTSDQYKASQAWQDSAAGVVIDDTPGPSSLSDLKAWADGLAKLLSYITSGAFWRRFGVGALGVGLILLALGLLVVASRS